MFCSSHAMCSLVDVKRERKARESNAGAREKRMVAGWRLHEWQKKLFSFSLIERVILSAGAMLIFSVSFQILNSG